MRKRRSKKTTASGGPAVNVDAELLALASALQNAREQAKQLGIFIDDRELLRCHSCGLNEDIEFSGRLITYFGEPGSPDTGLRFKKRADGKFRCPKCRTLLTSENPDDSE